MNQNLIGELLIFMNMNVKPNFSELQRKYGVDRHTISKYWKHGGKPQRKTPIRKSTFDDYLDEIKQLFNKPGVTKRAAYEFLIAKYDEETFGTYNTFRTYTYRKGIKPTGKKGTPHVRYETKPAEQLQVDWKENMSITTKTGEALEFHLMSSTLGYSRLHTFVYTKTKTTEDFLRCVIDIVNQLGGLPHHILTDNMSAIVSIKNGSKHKHQKIRAFEKDTGVKIKLCQARRPQTKGKTESANRFASWLKAYDGEIENEKELIDIIEQLNRRVNQTVNQTTCLPPITLFEKEKEYLKPLPNKILLDSYMEGSITQSVPSTLLVAYQGSGYSVPSRYIGKRIKIVPIDQQLYLYHNTTLITVHDIKKQKFNYHVNHYQEALKASIRNQEVDIESVAKENLELLNQLGGPMDGNSI